MRRSRPLSLLLLPALTLGACASTKLVSVWKDAAYAGGPIQKILVIGISDNERTRRQFEDSFVAEFERRGIAAVSGFKLLPREGELSAQEVRRAIEGSDIDTILVTRYAGEDEETVYRPGTTYIEPGGYYRSFNRYYHRSYVAVHEPGYYVKHKLVYLETNLYSASDGNLIWSARSETTNPDSATDLIDSMKSAVMKSLEEYGLLL